ncbi:signal peptidase, endoplasmic reticulum-type [Halobellus clavatus]|jgi:signal peptidase|uniref:Signal peptidase, endoplasmic reticulum-type n=1 Tax=Halobellus clavatus TaxID=660517 RepID=A0A1H3E6J5_9EURY|nr:signal peptidase, endoplasmic reticulum-type [Halobellus clavatus]
MTDDEGGADRDGRPTEGPPSPDPAADTDVASDTTAETDDTDVAVDSADSGGADPDDDGEDPDEVGNEPDVPVGVAESRREGRPRPQPSSAATGSQNVLTRFRTAQSGPLVFIRETLYSVAAVLAVGFLLFAISGVWPPMVAVESGSMEPQMHRGDLIFVTEPQRFSPDYARGGTGVVTVEVGSDNGYRSFGGNGSVVIYDPPDRRGSPIIHRAHFYVDDGENWYDEANPDHVRASNCAELTNCPAPHAGFITKGDANARYDQASGIAGPVRPGWVRGTARFRIPYLGYVRLKLVGLLAA